jgi:hypothetical protein
MTECITRVERRIQSQNGIQKSNIHPGLTKRFSYSVQVAILYIIVSYC